MKRVNIADLKNNLSRHLSHVRHGGDIIVLDRDMPVARIIPFDRPEGTEASGKNKADEFWTDDRLARMEQRGTIVRGSARASAAWAKELRPARVPRGTPSAVDLVIGMRRESSR